MSRWTTLRAELSRPTAPASDMIARMQALKAEAEAAQVDSCSAPAKAQLLDSITQTIAMAQPLTPGKNQPDPISQENVDKAFQLQQEAEATLRQCAG
jgi:hypothetical protein